MYADSLFLALKETVFVIVSEKKKGNSGICNEAKIKKITSLKTPAVASPPLHVVRKIE